jgi:uncharacterized membrane protein YagU involved in acid resistance
VRRVDGALAGLVAAGFKAFSEQRLQVATERILPPSPTQKQAVGADPTGRPENMPPAVIVGRSAVALGHEPLTISQRLRLQRTIHYAFGAVAGVAYFAAARRWSIVSRGGGAVAGLVLYAATHGTLLPALTIQPWPWQLAPATVVWEAGSHVLFGGALEAARHGL